MNLITSAIRFTVLLINFSVMQKMVLLYLLSVRGMGGVAQKETIPKYLEQQLHFTKKIRGIYAAIGIGKLDHCTFLTLPAPLTC